MSAILSRILCTFIFIDIRTKKKGTAGWRSPRESTKWRLLLGLEGDLPAQLEHTRRRVKSQERAVGAGRGAGHTQDLSEGRIAKRGVGLTEVRVVEHVEGLEADAELHALAERHVLEQGHIHVEEMRTNELVAVLRREAFVDREARRIGIDKSVDVQARRDCGGRVAGGLRRTLAGVRRQKRAAAVAEGRVAVGNRERQTRAPEHLARPLPATQHGVGDVVAELVGWRDQEVAV